MSSPDDAFTSIVHPEVSAYLERLGGEDDSLISTLEDYARERHFPLVGRSSGRVLEQPLLRFGGRERVLEQLTRLIGGRRVFEFGSGYGFSAFFFARAVGEGGQVIGSEKDGHEVEAHARLYGDHPLRARIQIHQGDAFEIFDGLEGSFDVVFLDLHKQGYRTALNMALPRVRPGGLILADNVLWGGKTSRVAADPDTAALQAFNAAIFEDPRLDTSILAVGDGLAVCRVV